MINIRYIVYIPSEIFINRSHIEKARRCVKNSMLLYYRVSKTTQNEKPLYIIVSYLY